MALARSLKPSWSSGVQNDPFIIESFRTLGELFEAPTSPGPVGYARTVGGDDADLERARLYAYGLVDEFLDAIRGGSQE